MITLSGVFRFIFDHFLFFAVLSSTALFCKEWYAPSIAPDSWRVSRSPSPPSIDEPIEGDVLDFELDLLNADYTSFALATTKPPKMTQPASMPPLPAALEALKPKPPQMPAPMKLPSAPVTRSAKRKLAGTQTPAMLKVKAEPLDEYTPTLEELLEAELTDDEEEKLELKNSIVRVSCDGAARQVFAHFPPFFRLFLLSKTTSRTFRRRQSRSRRSNTIRASRARATNASAKSNSSAIIAITALRSSKTCRRTFSIIISAKIALSKSAAASDTSVRNV